MAVSAVVAVVEATEKVAVEVLEVTSRDLAVASAEVAVDLRAQGAEVALARVAVVAVAVSASLLSKHCFTCTHEHSAWQALRSA